MNDEIPYRVSPQRLIIAGTISICFGVWRFYEKKKRLKTWIPTVGTIYNVRRDRKGNVTVYVKYLDRQGAKYSCSLPFSDGDRIGLGSELPIAYNPNRPSHAFIAEKTDMNFTVIAAIVVGVVLIGAGILFSTRM